MGSDPDAHLTVRERCWMHQRREVERRKAFVAPTPIVHKLKPRRPHFYFRLPYREGAEAGGALGLSMIEIRHHHRGKRLYIAGFRIHHGTLGLALAALGTALAAHDWRDYKRWLAFSD